VNYVEFKLHGATMKVDRNIR